MGILANDLKHESRVVDTLAVGNPLYRQNSMDVINLQF